MEVTYKNEIFEVEFITLRGDLFAIVYEVSTTNKREYIMTSILEEGTNHVDGNTMKVYLDKNTSNVNDLLTEHHKDPIPTVSYSYMKRLYRDYIIERIKNNKIDWGDALSNLLVDGLGMVAEIGILVSQIIIIKNAMATAGPEIMTTLKGAVQMT